MALALVRESELRGRLAGFSARGLEQERGEDFQEAHRTYRRALAVDSSLEFALVGMKRVERMIRLDVASADYIAKPELLTKSGMPCVAMCLSS